MCNQSKEISLYKELTKQTRVQVYFCYLYSLFHTGIDKKKISKATLTKSRGLIRVLLR